MKFFRRTELEKWRFPWTNQEILLAFRTLISMAIEKRREMEIKRSGSQTASKGPADWFTGSVRVDPLFEPPDPARVRCASVTFQPGARTAWHTHPLGQTLIVTSGVGWAQRD